MYSDSFHTALETTFFTANLVTVLSSEKSLEVLGDDPIE